MVVVVPHVEVPTDDIGNPSGRPRLVGEAVVTSTLPQEGAKLLVLGGRQAGGAAGGDGRLERAAVFEPLDPVPYGKHGDAEVVSDLAVRMGATVEPLGGCQAAFFKLGAGIPGRVPFGHTSSVSARTYAVINKLPEPSGKYAVAAPQTKKEAQQQIATLLRKNAESMKALA